MLDLENFRLAVTYLQFQNAGLLRAQFILADRYSCLTPAKNEGIDIDSARPIAESMINQKTIFGYPLHGQRKQKCSRIQ